MSKRTLRALAFVAIVAVLLPSCAARVPTGHSSSRGTVTATASPTLSPSPSPSPTVSPKPPKPDPIVRRPLLSPRYVFGHEVPSWERQIVQWAITSANRFFRFPHHKSDEERAKIYVYGDFNAMIRSLMRALNVDRAFARSYWSWAYLSARTWASSPPIIFLYTARGFPSWSRSEQVRLLAHEWFHAYQFSLAHSPLITWLAEGSAEYAARKIVAALGLASYDVAKATYRRMAIYGTRTPLRSMEDWEGFEGAAQNGSQYAVAFLAVDFLLEGRGGPLAALRFWRAYANSHDINDSFRRTFGMSLPAFYKAFEQYRDHGYLR